MTRKTPESLIKSSQVDWHTYWKDKALEERKRRIELESQVGQLQIEVSYYKTLNELNNGPK